MFAQQLISNEIFPLKKNDTVETALLFMDDWQVKDLPVVESGKVLGYVSRPALENIDETKKVHQCMNQGNCSLHEFTHVFDVMKKMNDAHVSVVAVTDDSSNFIGMVAARDLSAHLYQHSALQQDGGIIMLQMEAINYSLAEIARISEVNNARILHVMVQAAGEGGHNVNVSLKFNTTELKFILATFERFNYNIVYATHQPEEDDAMNNRFNWLIKYLNT